jgi:hypothetical protein
MFTETTSDTKTSETKSAGSFRVAVCAALVALFLASCAKKDASSTAASDENAVLAMSSFYPGENAPGAIVTSTSGDGGFIPGPGTTGGSDSGSIPAPGTGNTGTVGGGAATGGTTGTTDPSAGTAGGSASGGSTTGGSTSTGSTGTANDGTTVASNTPPSGSSSDGGVITNPTTGGSGDGGTIPGGSTGGNGDGGTVGGGSNGGTTGGGAASGGSAGGAGTTDPGSNGGSTAGGSNGGTTGGTSGGTASNGGTTGDGGTVPGGSTGGAGDGGTVPGSNTGGAGDGGSTAGGGNSGGTTTGGGTAGNGGTMGGGTTGGGTAGNGGGTTGGGTASSGGGTTGGGSTGGNGDGGAVPGGSAGGNGDGGTTPGGGTAGNGGTTGGGTTGGGTAGNGGGMTNPPGGTTGGGTAGNGGGTTNPPGGTTGGGTAGNGGGTTTPPGGTTGGGTAGNGGGTTTPPGGTTGGGTAGNGGGTTPPGGTPGGTTAGNGGGTTTPPGNTGGGGGTTNPPDDGAVCNSKVNVTLTRVCSAMRSQIAYPKFVFFEEAKNPIISVEAIETKYLNNASNDQKYASMGWGSMPQDHTRWQLAKTIDLRSVNLLASRYTAQVGLAVSDLQKKFDKKLSKIAVSIRVCDDVNHTGRCTDKGGTQYNLMTMPQGEFTLNHIPSRMSIEVWAGRYRTASANSDICEKQYSPLILDLTGAGFKLQGPESGIRFDLMATGTPVNTGWVASNNVAFLVRDLNSDRHISSGLELFGNATRLKNGHVAANGFEALKDLDDDSDGLFTPNDAEWDHVKLWIDSKRNGQVDPREIFSLDYANIQSINLDYIGSNEIDAYGNQTRQRSTFKRNVNGVAKIMQIIDIWFNTFVAQ